MNVTTEEEEGDVKFGSRYRSLPSKVMPATSWCRISIDIGSAWGSDCWILFPPLIDGDGVDAVDDDAIESGC